MKRMFLLFLFPLSFFGIIFSINNNVFGEEAFKYEVFKYEVKDRRDPFMPLITGEKKITVGLETVESVDDIKFEGIIFDPNGKSIAVLNGEIVRENDVIGNVAVVKIFESAIKLKIYEKEYSINLVEERGE